LGGLLGLEFGRASAVLPAVPRRCSCDRQRLCCRVSQWWILRHFVCAGTAMLSRIALLAAEADHADLLQREQVCLALVASIGACCLSASTPGATIVTLQYFASHLVYMCSIRWWSTPTAEDKWQSQQEAPLPPETSPSASLTSCLNIATTCTHQHSVFTNLHNYRRQVGDCHRRIALQKGLPTRTHLLCRSKLFSQGCQSHACGSGLRLAWHALWGVRPNTARLCRWSCCGIAATPVR
jgi:hypothetical protein